MNTKVTKSCFVIAPIGEEGTDIRRRSDQVLKHIICPAAEKCGYEEPIRADQISEPGIITSQVIQHLIDDHLVIADLTGRNPNVFYELAIRHAVRKAVVQIIQVGETIPFDVAASRTIHVDHRDLDSAASCKETLVRQIQAVERDPSQVDTPISVAIDLKSLRQSDNPLEKSAGDIIGMLQEMGAMLSESRRTRVHPRMFDEMLMMFDRVSDLLDFPDGAKHCEGRTQEARNMLERATRFMLDMAMESGVPREVLDEFYARAKGRGRMK